MQFFSRNPRGAAVKTVNNQDISDFVQFNKDNGINVLVAHAPYTLNTASDDIGLRRFAKNTMADDIAKLDSIPNALYNFHPGSHKKQGVNIGVQLVADALNEILTTQQKTVVLLETMAGKGSELGANFYELKQIIDKVELNQLLGVCLDTCHVFDAGYDIVNKLDDVINEFDQIVGLHKLKAVHLNDSLNTLGSHKDRHAKLGQGNIGLNAIFNIANHPKLKNLPFILETPNDINGYQQEIELVKSNCMA
jgi:deoxyribonuclease-4